MEEPSNLVDREVIDLEPIGDGWRIHAVGADVGQVALGFGIRIVLYIEGGDALHIFIERTFHYDLGDGADDEVDPQEATPALGVVAVGLLHRRLLSCDVSVDGELRLRFVGGIALRVLGGAQFEAWSIDGPTFRLVATPDGDVAYWDLDDPARETPLR